MNRGDARILKVLYHWNYQRSRATGFNIAMRAGYSVSHTYVTLRKLIYNGWIKKRRAGDWNIYILTNKKIVEDEFERQGFELFDEVPKDVAPGKEEEKREAD